MKKILAIAAAVLTIGIAGAQQVRSPYKTVGAALPSLRIVDRSMQPHTEAEINKKNHSFVVMFNPTCHHCIDVAKMFGTHKKDFRKNTIFFVAAADMMPYMDHFYKETGAAEFDNITIGVDSSSIITNLYKYGNLPQINIYDKNKKLVRIFSGETPLDSLLQYAN